VAANKIAGFVHTVKRMRQTGCTVTRMTNSAVKLTFLSQVPMSFMPAQAQPDTHSTFATPMRLVPERVHPNANMI
jgi:hypothetical protein